ncbi:Trimeric GatFAB AmidoTransferase(AdT) complex subunit [Actinomortierella wolfii]|nr:Trimeric GatFAB AmidoTransferase(AdT) complex subunit [Actinomortierella wolfii]
MKRSASEINAENEALEALLRDRLNNITERLHNLTQQTTDLYDQTKNLANVIHEKQRRLYHIEDHLLQLQGKPGLSELYLENGSQPRRLTKELDELRMGVKTLRRKFQAASNVITTAGWWRHLKVDTDKANKSASPSSAASAGISDNKARSPVLVASPVAFSPTRSSRSTVSLDKIFTSPASPTSSSTTTSAKSGGSQTAFPSSRDWAAKNPSVTSPSSEQANPSHALRSPPLTPKTASSPFPLFKGFNLAEAESRLDAKLPSARDRESDHSSPTVMMVTSTAATKRDPVPFPGSGRPLRAVAIPSPHDAHAESTSPVIAPPSPVHTASEAEDDNSLALEHINPLEVKEQSTAGKAVEAESEQSHNALDLENKEAPADNEDTKMENHPTDSPMQSTDTSSSSTILPNAENEQPTHDTPEASGENSSEGDWEEVEEEENPVASSTDTKPNTVGTKQKAPEQTEPEELNGIQRLWQMLVRMEYFLLGTAVFGAMLPDNIFAFCTGFISAVTFALIHIVQNFFGRGVKNEETVQKRRVVFTYGRGSTSRYRSAGTSTPPSRSPASTISQRRRGKSIGSNANREAINQAIGMSVFSTAEHFGEWSGAKSLVSQCKLRELCFQATLPDNTPATIAAKSLDQTTKYNKVINAFVDRVASEDIQRQAEESTIRWVQKQPKSAIDGALVGIKMNICTDNMRTTCGSRMLENFQSPFDATAVQLLKEAGAIIAGKTNMDEFGMGSYNVHSATGVSVNPHDLVRRGIADAEPRTPGGSSGGSAAAVAANMCFAALGSDTGGSVRLPASYCGVVGFKPSYGRISRWGLVAYGSSLDCVGILAKTVDDVKAVYDVTSKEDPKDSTCLTKEQRDKIARALKPIPVSNTKDTANKPLSGIRIGIPEEFNVEELSEPTKLLWRRGIKALKEAGATVIPVNLPCTKAALSTYFTLATAEASSNLQRYDGVRYGHQSDQPDSPNMLYAHTRTEGFGDEVKRRILAGTFVLTSGSYENYFVRAQKARTLIRCDFDNVFARPNVITGTLSNSVDHDNNIHDPNRVHALLAPAAVTTAPKISQVLGEGVDPLSEYLDDVLTVPASLAGIPAMSVPFGTSAQDGQPLGLQVMAQYGDEEMVFTVGRVLESAGKVL